MKKREREGYSLVELMIAMALTVFVIAGLIALLGYGTRNMRIAQTLVALQDQAKDAVNHISAYTMEASDIEWDEDKKVLVVTKKSIPQETDSEGKYPDPEVEKYYYWQGEEDGVGGIYFAKHSKVQDASDSNKVNLVAAKKYLLVNDIQDFRCEVKEDSKTKKKVLHIEIDLASQNGEAKFECKKDVYMRNQ